MKKTIISLAALCVLLTTNYGSRAAGICYSSYGTATCEANYGQYSSDSFEYATNSGLTLMFWAYLGGSGPDYQAYSYAGWSTSGPVGYYYNSAGNTYYYYDGLALNGIVNLNAFTQGAGSSAGVTATW